jgi:tetratricopeptide (TPR) repeat protein
MHRSPGHCPQRSVHFIVPYQRNEHFTGRKELLDTFFGKLNEIIPRSHNHRLALYGLGGVGKTQLALQYAYTYKANYDAIYWISAVNQASLLSGLREVGKRTGCLLNVDSAEKGVVSWLNQQDRWLLILDNLDDATVVDGFLPDTSPNQHTLITTRNPNTDEIPAEGLEISVLQLQDAIDLLYLRSKVPRISQIPNGEAEATKIVQELGLLPLAVEQAAAYIREVSKDIFKFLPSYQKNRQRYHRRIPRGNWKYQNSIATTWRLSFERVEQNNIAAAQLLRLLSFLNPDGILTEFLETGKEGLSTDLLDTIADSDKFDEALSELERWSIIRREPDEAGGQRITIHRLVQAVIKDEMTEADFLLFTGEVLSLCDRSFPQYGLKKELRPLCRKYQTQVIIPLSEIPVTKSTTQLRLLKRISWFLHDDGKYSQSREMKLKVVELCTLLVGKDHPDTLSAKGKLAVTYSREGRLTEAIQLQSEILDEMSAQLGAEHPKVLTIISNLALTHLQQGHLQEALILQKRALEARKRILGDEHPDTLTAMSRLGATHRTQERWNEAVELHEKVLAARARLLGEEHPDTLMAMSSLAYSYIGPYRWVEAQKLLEKVIVARMCLLGGDHMDTLTTMSRLALTYAGQRRWDDALKLQTEALEGWTKMCGEDHPETLTALSWLASTYWEMNDGQRDHAVRLYKKVLAARVRVLGKDHPTTLSTEKMVDDIAEIGEGS